MLELRQLGLYLARRQPSTRPLMPKITMIQSHDSHMSSAPAMDLPISTKHTRASCTAIPSRGDCTTCSNAFCVAASSAALAAACAARRLLWRSDRSSSREASPALPASSSIRRSSDTVASSSAARARCFCSNPSLMSALRAANACAHRNLGFHKDQCLHHHTERCPIV